MKQFGTMWMAANSLWAPIKQQMADDNWLMYNEATRSNLWKDPSKGPARFPPLGFLRSFRQNGGWQALDKLADKVGTIDPGWCIGKNEANCGWILLMQ